MDFVAEIVKFLGTLLATVAAVIGVYQADTKSIESGKITNKGRTIIAFAAVGLALSGIAQGVQVLNSQQSAKSVRERNEETARRLERIPLLVARPNFPLEPMEIFFSIEYKMDDPTLKDYAERLRKDIVAYLVAAREGRGKTDETLADEDVLFVVSNRDEWLPNREAERAANAMLTTDYTRFEFFDPEKPDASTLKLLSSPPGLVGVVVSMKRFGDLEQKIELNADFKRRVFTKSVMCRNPIRSGDDVTSFSSLDLVGRKMRWSTDGQDRSPALTSFEMRFSYDYGYLQNYHSRTSGREVEIGDKKELIITEENVGLSSLRQSAH